MNEQVFDPPTGHQNEPVSGAGDPGNRALWLDRLAIVARMEVAAAERVGEISLPELEQDCIALARRYAEEDPLSPPTVGFDRPANVYLVSEIYQAGGHRVLLEQMIASRPGERHIVVFSGALSRTLDYGIERMRQIGAFPVFPDPQSTLHDRYDWLRRKLSCFAAQRLILFHHPEDVLATAAAYELADRYGRRLYVVRHSDTRPTLGAELASATHVAIREEQADLIRERYPEIDCVTLPLSHTTERASSRALEEGFFPNGVFTTATAGGEHKFDTDGDLAFAEVLLGIVRASRGRHIHFGAVSDSLVQAVQRRFSEEKLPRERVAFVGDVPSIADALRNHRVDLFIASFPVGGGLTVTEAASVGMPIAVFDPGPGDSARRYASGAGHRPGDALVWTKPASLFRFLRKDADDTRLAEMAQSSMDWYDRRLSPAKFRRRLAAIFAMREGRARGAMAERRADIIAEVFDPVFYAATYPDVTEAGLDPLDHFVKFGDKRGRRPNALFDPAHYLAQLSEGERAQAKDSPLTHYATRGELRGLRPHPFFDPALCAAGTNDLQGHTCVLALFLAGKAAGRPHTLFDDRHYLRQRGYIEASVPPLVHFLTEGAQQATSPHPLIDLRRFGPDPQAAILHYVSKESPDAGEPSPCPLFDPRFFCKGNVHAWRGAAPNLLWAHLIEGSRRFIDPHPLISTDHMARAQEELLRDTQTVLEQIAARKLVGETHPLVRSTYIDRQAPWLRSTGQHPTQYFIEHGVAHNIDPHPYFSTQYYLYNNQDVLQSGTNPLVHYLTSGQFEGRLPHPFFDGNHYYRAWMQGRPDVRHGPLVDYVSQGAGAFRHVQPTDGTVARLKAKMARRLFATGDDEGAADFLRDATHSDAAVRHPTLICEVRRLGTTLPELDNEDEALAPASFVHVRRPRVVHPVHISLDSGSYETDAPRAVLCPDATVIGGNDGVITEDGTWLDLGLKGFDPETMQLKENGGTVAISDEKDRLLLRRHAHSTRLPSGILASGTYSHNYYHFLIEILPRAMSAHLIAPPEVPILADDNMPEQHFQVLRTFFPRRSIRRLARGFSYEVDELYLGNMANAVHDVVDADKAPVDAVRYHPDILRWLNWNAEAYRTDETPRRLYFKRESGVRRLLNAAQIEQEMVARGFEIVRCDQLSFSEQVRLAANAEVIVGQSGAHLANIVFARPGTRVFALYSNSPGTNYYLWDGIGRALGLDVINVVGWRIVGSTAQGIARIHEDFTIPLDQLLPFFPRLDEEAEEDEREPAVPERLRPCLDMLYGANSEADTLTAAWAVTADRTPDWFEERLVALRSRVGELIDGAPEDEVSGLLDHAFFVDFGRNVRSGFGAERDLGDEERDLAARVRADFERWARDPEGWTPTDRETTEDKTDAEDDLPEDAKADDASSEDGADRQSGRKGVDPDDPETSDDEDRLKERNRELERLLALTMLYLPARDLPMVSDVAAMPQRLAERYIAWIVAPPFLFRDGEDLAYAAFAAELLNWFDAQLSSDLPRELKGLLYRTVTDLDLGQLLLIDSSLKPVTEARNRLLDRFAPNDRAARATPRVVGGAQGKHRIGILCRTFDKGPDSEAIVSFFKAFDKSRYEIFAYSVGFRDRVVTADAEFEEEFDSVIDHRRILTADPRDMRESLLDDDLDVFLHANATTYGLRAQELALYHRVAPIQMVLNSHVPMPFGFPSFDAYVTGRSDDAAFDIDDADYAETLIRCDGPVICYLNSLKVRSEPLFSRADVGLSDDDIVLMNAGSLSKLRHACLRTMMLALKAVPDAKLLLAPYNPGWVARSQAFAFNRQLAEMCDALDVDPARVLVMGELSVAEAESALALSDIYLNPFPHGGATMTHLALINGKPPITLRRRSSRSIDQFLIQSIGAQEVLANSAEDYVERVRRVAEDRELCQSLSRRIRDAAQTPPFVNNPEFSRSMQEVIDQALADFGSR